MSGAYEPRMGLAALTQTAKTTHPLRLPGESVQNNAQTNRRRDCRRDRRMVWEEHRLSKSVNKLSEHLWELYETTSASQARPTPSSHQIRAGIILYYMLSYIIYYIIVQYIMLCYVMLHYIILYHIILYYGGGVGGP